MPRLFDPDGINEIAARHSSFMRLGDVGRRYMAGIGAFAFALLCVGLVEAEFSVTRMVSGAARLGDFAVLMLPPEPGPNLKLYVFAMIETLGIALLGTLIASSLAFQFAVLASRNVLPFWIVRFIMLRSFDTIRGVETLIWALIWISAVGMGPFAGVLAMATADFGACRGHPVDRWYGGAGISFWHSPSGLAGHRGADSLLFRVQHPVGNDHRHCWRRRDWTSSLRIDPYAGVATGFFHCLDDPGHRGGD